MPKRPCARRTSLTVAGRPMSCYSITTWRIRATSHCCRRSPGRAGHGCDHDDAFGTPEMSDAALRIGAYGVHKPFEVHAANLVLDAYAAARFDDLERVCRYFFTLTLKLNVTVSTNGVGMPFSTSGE